MHYMHVVSGVVVCTIRHGPNALVHASGVRTVLLDTLFVAVLCLDCRFITCNERLICRGEVRVAFVKRKRFIVHRVLLKVCD